MATRFYMEAEGAGAPSVSPAFDAGWEQTGEATRLKLVRKQALTTVSTIAPSGNRTVPITTTQDILCQQFVGPPMRPQNISGTFSLILKANTSATTTNTTLAVVVRVVSQDGVTSRGTLFSNFSQDAALIVPGATNGQTVIVNAQAITPLITQPGDRIVIEIGANAAAPSGSGTYVMLTGDSAGVTNDFALTSGTTGSGNPWAEFSQNLTGFGLQNSGLRPAIFKPGIAR